jgi:hypothetical protein
MEPSETLVMYPQENDHDALMIYHKLCAPTDQANPAYPTITDWMRRFHRGRDIANRASGSGRLLDEQINIFIATAPEDSVSFSPLTLFGHPVPLYNSRLVPVRCMLYCAPLAPCSLHDDPWSKSGESLDGEGIKIAAISQASKLAFFPGGR